MPRKVTPEQEQEICNLYRSGRSMPNLGIQFGLDPSSVCDLLKRNGVQARSQQELNPKKLSNCQLEEIAIRHVNGESLRALSKEYSISRTSLTKALASSGVDFRSSYEDRHKYRVNLERQSNPIAYDRNREKEYARARRLSDPFIAKRNRQYTAQWRKNNPERAKTYERNRRALELGATGSHTTKDVYSIYEDQLGKCYYCKKEVSWKEKHVEHKQPLSKSGSNDKSNLAVSCAKCNLSKGSKTEEEFLEFLGAMAPSIGLRFQPHAQCSSKSLANREAAAL